MEREKTQTEEQKKETRTTNREYAEKNEPFKQACEKAEVKPTGRQASKWRRKTGKAWNVGRN